MKNIIISNIITHLGNRQHLRLDSEGYMTLVIESIQGPNNLPAFSLAHYGEQNGDAMRDPEVCFEVSSDEILPFSFLNDYMGIYQEVYSTNGGGPLVRNQAMAKDIEQFLNDWARNLKDQGFLDEISQTN